MRVTSGGSGQDAPPSRSLAATARRAQIVAATIEVIAEEGYARATFSRIAQQAGLSSTRLISYHFGSRDELMEQVLVEVGTGAQRAIGEQVAAETTATGRLHARIEAQLRWIAAYPGQVRALYEISMNARDDEGGLRYGPEASAEANLTELEPILTAGQQSGEFREFDVRLMGLTIKSGIDAAIARMFQPAGLTVDECVREITTWVGLATRRLP
ncbi:MULTISPECIES: TetR/AcrR family transcriptional regulator [Streptacidiphilus]|uniref:TetR/AcrR family transcriptional regulator n=1 Tax=Streptacidiphilus cavernicola TaxID=3342716 RepID=A0ABV6UWI3_9ACTN|nr:TetR/AcrR family transcriptional regulator [Streptacidiphilus jeojiense]